MLKSGQTIWNPVFGYGRVIDSENGNRCGFVWYENTDNRLFTFNEVKRHLSYNTTLNEKYKDTKHFMIATSNPFASNMYYVISSDNVSGLSDNEKQTMYNKLKAENKKNSRIDSKEVSLMSFLDEYDKILNETFDKLFGKKDTHNDSVHKDSVHTNNTKQENKPKDSVKSNVTKDKKADTNFFDSIKTYVGGKEMGEYTNMNDALSKALNAEDTKKEKAKEPPKAEYFMAIYNGKVIADDNNDIFWDYDDLVYKIFTDMKEASLSDIEIYSIENPTEYSVNFSFERV